MIEVKQTIRCADCGEPAKRMVNLMKLGWIPFCKACAGKHGRSSLLIDYYIRPLKVMEYQEDEDDMGNN